MTKSINQSNSIVRKEYPFFVKMKIVITLLVVVHNDLLNLIKMLSIDCSYKYLLYNTIYGINTCTTSCYIVKHKVHYSYQLGGTRMGAMYQQLENVNKISI